jgi:catechol 2,3-dioxygenase-like lactoylglutathione lyase family enzyme
MLANANVIPTIAVKDTETAKKFYGETLGLELISEGVEGLYYKSGDGSILVYPSEFAGTNKATYCAWSVEDVDAEVDALKAKGVPFEHYDFPGVTMEGDIHVMGDMRSAWFTDPDGNIFALDQRR